MVWLAIWLAVQETFGLGVEAVQSPVGSRLSASVPIAVRWRTVYDFGGWSFWPFLGPSSDTAWYIGPGWQGAQPQWCTGPYALPSVVPCDRMPSSWHTKQWCSQSRCSQWCSCRTLRIWRPMPNLFSLLKWKRSGWAFVTTVLVCVEHDNCSVMRTQINVKLSTRSTTAPSM